MQTFKAYWTESYKYCIILHCISNTKIYSLLRKILLSISILFSVYCDLCFLCLFSSADVLQFLDTVLCKILNVTNDHLYHCIKNRVYDNFNLHYFVFSIIESMQIFLKLKLNNSVEVLQHKSLWSQPVSEAATGGVSYKKAVLKNVIPTGKQLWWNLFVKKKFQCKCLPVKFVKFLRTLFLQNTNGDCFCCQNRSKEKPKK